MINQQHPIIPPEDLLQQLRRSADTWLGQITIAYQAGADQELEACVKWIEDCGYHPSVSEDFRDARRPKPPTLKEQAYDALDTYIYGEPDPKDKERTYNTIRRALEALDD
jgi:hydrogenase maturation factor HypE